MRNFVTWINKNYHVERVLLRHGTLFFRGQVYYARRVDVF